MTATVIVVGSVNVDLVVRLPRLPAPGETVTGGQFSRHPGGKGGNQAAAAARLGARVAMIGAVGDDELGRTALDDLRAARVDVAGVVAVTAPTGVALITVDRRGENQIAVASGANHELSAEQVRAGIEAAVVDGAVVLVSLELADGAVAAAVETAESAGLPVVLNPGPARVLPDEVLGGVSVLTPNEHEVGGLGPPGVAGLLDLGVGAVVVTRGAAGCELHRPGREVLRQAAYPVDVVDTVGAGDAFSGALAWALADRRPLEEAVRLAAAAGALATRRPGARGDTSTAEDVLELVGAAHVRR